MLKIRLARAGRKKRPFFRVVLTEHTKPPKSGYKLVLGWYDPIIHKFNAKVEEVKKRIGYGAQPSERVAKLLYKYTGDDFFKKFFVERTRNRAKRKEEKK